MLEKVFEENFELKSQVEKEKIKFIVKEFKKNSFPFRDIIRMHGLREVYRFLRQTLDSLPKKILLITPGDVKVKDMKENIYLKLGYYEIPYPQKLNPESIFNGKLEVSKHGVAIFEKYWKISNLQNHNNLYKQFQIN